MILNIFLIVLGVIFVLKGADFMTDGAVSIAERLNIPSIVIGLTIVAMGTSMPEFCVSLVSALKGTSDLAVGNVVGSNIFNVLLIVGVAALVSPMVISKSTVKKDVPWGVFSALALSLMCLDMQISRIDALILTVGFIAFMAYTLLSAKNGKSDQPAEEKEEKKEYKPIVAVGLILLGLAGLIVGSNVFVDAATEVAREFNVPEAVIGLTIVAGGTSLPELATSVVAARKGQSAIAIGNVIGSNVFNVLMILGITGLICPMQIQGITVIDLSVMTVSIALLWLFSYTKFTVERWEAALLTAIFIGYMAWLIANVI